jgi:DNA-binding PadR family transcriptional regulator
VATRGDPSTGRLVRQFVHGAIEVHALHHADEGAVHGAWLAAELARHGYRVSPGTLYPLLHRLETDGLLASRKHVVEGRARRAYAITAKGRRALTQLRRAVEELAEEVLAEPSPRTRSRTRANRL